MEATESMLSWLLPKAGYATPFEKNLRVYNLEVLYYELAKVLREEGRMPNVFYAEQRLEEAQTYIQEEGNASYVATWTFTKEGDD